jgi:hypothetical protein
MVPKGGSSFDFTRQKRGYLSLLFQNWHCSLLLDAQNPSLTLRHDADKDNPEML